MCVVVADNITALDLVPSAEQQAALGCNERPNAANAAQLIHANHAAARGVWRKCSEPLAVLNA